MVQRAGDKVRLAISPEKDKLEYKAYKAIAWSKKRYVVLAKRGNTYKIDGPSGKKFYHRDNLRLTADQDAASNAIIAERKTKYKKREIRHEEKTARRVTESEYTRTGRPTRASAKRGVAKRLADKKRMRLIDEYVSV